MNRTERVNFSKKGKAGEEDRGVDGWGEVKQKYQGGSYFQIRHLLSLLLFSSPYLFLFVKCSSADFLKAKNTQRKERASEYEKKSR